MSCKFDLHITSIETLRADDTEIDTVQPQHISIGSVNTAFNLGKENFMQSLIRLFQREYTYTKNSKSP